MRCLLRASISSRRAREESGLALVLVLMVISAITLSTIGLVRLVSSNQTAFGRDRQVVRATNIGQQGLNYGLSYMQMYLGANDVGDTLPVGSQVGSAASPMYSGAVDGGTMSWYAVKNAASSWTIYANAVSPNGAVRRRFSLKVGGTRTSLVTSTSSSPVYGYGYVLADAGIDCAALNPPANGGNTIANGAALTVPTYIAGSLCITAGSPAIAEPIVEPVGTLQSVTLYVGKTFRTSNSPGPVGTSARPIKAANIVAGCQAYFKKNWTNQVCSTPGVPTSGTGSGIFATLNQSQQQPLIKPAIDTATYSSASPGPTHACNGASSKGLLAFDNDSIRNTSLQIPASSGSVSLLHLKSINQADAGNNFDCRFYDSTGSLVGRLMWVDGNPGTLTVSGTIFIDGNLNLSGNDSAVYAGTGVIYVDGTFTAGNGARLCAGSLVSGNCPTTWNTAINNLEVVVINHQNAANAVSFVGDARFQGIVFANGNFSSTAGASIYGTVIADSGQLSGGADFASPPQPPTGAPGAATAVVTSSFSWNVSKGGWSQL